MLLKGYFAKAFSLVLLAFVLLTAGSAALAQSTTFTYQGRLQDGGTPANGNYDLQFTLWDAASSGTQQPQPSPVTVTRTSVLVRDGIFSVPLDFGASAFPGADRFLEIGVRPTGGGAFTLLSPRQPISSTPYAIHSANATTADTATTATTATNATNATNATTAATATNATQLGGVAASQYVVTSDSRLTDSRAPTAGSVNYLQNTTSQQASSNFNVSGNGTAGGTLSANAVNAATQYNIGGNRVLIAPGSSNLFVGVGTGASNTLGAGNSFFGTNAGNNNSTGFANSFFGGTAGLHNTTGQRNSFFGSSAGFGNLVAGSTGSDNSFFGNATGLANSTGFNNSFFGSQAGQNNQTGNNNSFFGFNASGADGISNATAIGANASVTQSNSLVLGNGANVFIGTSSINGESRLNVYGTTNAGLCNVATIGFGPPIGSGCASALQLTTDASNSSNLIVGSNSVGPVFVVSGNGDVLANGKVGIGSFDSQIAQLLVTATSRNAGENTATFKALKIGLNQSHIHYGTTGDWYIRSAASSGRVILQDTGGNVGIGTASPDATLTVNGTADKPGGGSWGTFSDERLKNIKGRFTPGLKAVMQLEPLRYEYKRDNALNLKSDGEHVGFGAQAVQKIIPEAVTTNDKGYLLINNDPILWTMLNAIKEQQNQIETFRAQNAALNERLRAVEKNLRKRVGSARRRQVP